uniref:Uncharacterized protein n=1 Tax=Avena sativa TaxID=4498 RepID=A0ACD5YVM8_AVESA
MSICARMDEPRGGALGKRKEREYFSPPSSSSEQKQPQQQKALVPPLPRKPEARNKPLQLSRFANKPSMPPPPPPQDGNSKLLAGYLAHEFFRFGTILGERPPAPSRKESAAARLAPAPAPAPEPARRYAEASTLLMAGGLRIPGVVNPTQLGRWLRIKE